MAASLSDSRVGLGKKKKKLRKRKKMKIMEEALSSEPELEENSPAGRRDSIGSLGVAKDNFSSDEAVEGDNEDETITYDKENESAADSNVGTNAGWADAMAKILNKKTPKNKSTILIKNKELEKEKEKEKQERLEKRKQLDKKREWEMMCRVKPDVVKDKEVERNLQRIATRGVVQLFNAVRKHQKNVDEKMKEVGGSVRKRAKLMSTVTKKDFISVLRGVDESKDNRSPKGQNPKDTQTKGKSEQGSSWHILRDDFMMGATMKDWDKESDGPDNTE
ncbi:RRP15-like protein isoform X2 [Macrotis lagotis]|uniref:RRP15-like protein isoform X2 n=1 Tax=Macrotis lagotis TaxID=92651 RepID=UPI003D689DEB